MAFDIVTIESLTLLEILVFLPTQIFLDLTILLKISGLQYC